MARIHKTQAPASNTQVALDAAKPSNALAELAKQFQAHPAEISQRKKQLLAGTATLFQDESASRQPDLRMVRTDLSDIRHSNA